jgi:DNA-binding NarL/FixJ family response regulator
VGWNRLNEEERGFVRLALQGWTNAQIAASVYVSVRTVANRLRQIYALLGVRDRRDLVVHAETDPPGWLKDHA